MLSNTNRIAAVLGSTGSVGRQAIDALMALGVKINLLTAGNNITMLMEQIDTVHPEMVAVPSEKNGEILKKKYGDSLKIYSGDNAICDSIKACQSPLIVHSISGMAGLPAALCAAETGARIAMANKEALISAGHLIYDRLQKSGGELIPVDSEHSAIFQCLTTQNLADPKAPAKSDSVRRIILTASGGPFFGRNRESLYSVTPEEALAHPTWKMGKKITIDCATLMNKGFELIEACRLFGVTPEKVDVLIHRQSIIHSMVEYTDGAVIAEMSYPDMRDCVRYALAYPERAPFGGESLDFAKIGTLTFHTPDTEAFPLLKCAIDTWYMGGSAPASLIAADEEAVDAFLQEQISFGDIADAVIETMKLIHINPALCEAEIYEAEREARVICHKVIEKIISDN